MCDFDRCSPKSQFFLALNLIKIQFQKNNLLPLCCRKALIQKRIPCIWLGMPSCIDSHGNNMDERILLSPICIFTDVAYCRYNVATGKIILSCSVKVCEKVSITSLCTLLGQAPAIHGPK